MNAPEPSLRDVQRWMKARIRPSGGGPACTVRLNPQGGVAGEDRLAVYADGYIARMREALAEVYEAVRHLVGEQAFRGLAGDYAATRPSHDYNLSLAGRHLPEFLIDHDLTQRLPLLPDLARLEWAVSLAFHAPARDPLAPERLAALSLDAWERARLSFHPSVTLVESAWPILDLWNARKTPRQEIALDVANRPQSVLVFCQDLTVRCELIDTLQAAALGGLLAGQTLGAVCAGISDGAPPEVTRWFASWMARSLIVACIES